MATAAKGKVLRMGRKTRSERVQRAATRDAKTKGVRTLDEIFADREKAVRRGQYDILGRVKRFIVAGHPEIEFYKEGPFLAQLTEAGGAELHDPDGAALVLLGKWNRLPDVTTMIVNELCTECLAPCKACEGKGERLCMQPGCGGYGKIILSYKACEAAECKKATGEAKRGCDDCGGSGQVVDQTAECKLCNGAKKHTCPNCFGSGKEPTGRLKGADLDKEPTAPQCPACRGNRRKLEVDSQRWQDYAYGELEGYTALGPVTGMLIIADEVRDPEQHYELVKISPNASGNLAALLVKNPKSTGQPMYLLGGDCTLQRI